ncbi:ATP-binding protein [candidate division CSSED10-310 bacterium]|uniref:histidine kinase n=1 Tax=candidate division CSSED10-310 bacterium TaxID=2855610 RepID=A0ABV6Z6I8_UNCC1
MSLVFILAAGLIVHLVNTTLHEQALLEAEAKVRLYLDRSMALHTYFTKILKPNLFTWTEPFRDKDYFDPTWMSSTYALRKMNEYVRAVDPSGYYFKDAAVNARDPENEADDEERLFIAELNQNPALMYRAAVRSIDGKPFFVVLRRGEVMEKDCLRCHGDPADAPGDLVRMYGVKRSFHRETEVGKVIMTVSIKVPLAVAYAEADRFTLRLSAVLVLVLLILLLVSVSLQRILIFSPLALVRDKARQIISSSEHLGELIPQPFGQELGQAVAVFNEMSLSLRQSWDHLEERVKERTAELHQERTSLVRRVEEQTAELRAANVELAKSARLKDEFLATMSHELRTPLNAILGQSESLLEQLADRVDERQLKALQTIANRGHHLLVLINHILDLSHLAAGKRKLELRPISIPSLCQACLETVAPTAQDRSIDLSLDVDEQISSIQADERGLQQILVNLLLNALKFTPPGGRVGLVVKSDPVTAAIRFTIWDTGIGIKSEDLPRLFQPLVQLDSSLSRQSEGTGLGLALVRNLVELHGGTVTVTSEPGKGSRFSVSLPRHSP